MTRDRLIALVLGTVGVVTAVCGLILGGNPATARREQRDQRRAEQLSQVNNLINNEYALTMAIPTSTEAYRTLIETRGMPNDSSFLEIPDYRFLGSDSYELCTTFEAETGLSRVKTTPLPPPGIQAEESPQFWTHGTGRTCYSVRVPSWIKTEANTRKTTNPAPVTPIQLNSPNP